MADSSGQDRAEAVASYKAYLREMIDKRPSGLRGRLARALDKHRSFISQITNPSYSVPIPAGDLRTILDLCHVSGEERQRFMRLYEKAHPGRALRLSDEPAREIRIGLPAFRSDATAREVESLILEFAARSIRLAERLDKPAKR